MDKNIEIFILTYDKKIDEEYDERTYIPLVCGEGIKNVPNNYAKDNTGKNISHLNKYYSELTGEYWAWQNTTQDIIGFCHYRRWFVKNLKWEKITYEDIIQDLNEYDIILPKKMKFPKALYDFHKEYNVKRPDYEVLYEDYVKLENVLKKFFPEYAESYIKVMNGKFIWTNNMFICKRELAEKYFQWLFEVLDKLIEEIDLSNYESRDSRIFGFIGERLLTTFILKNSLRFKEYTILFNERKYPILHVIYSKYPNLNKIEKFITLLLKRIR